MDETGTNIADTGRSLRAASIASVTRGKSLEQLVRGIHAIEPPELIDNLRKDIAGRTAE